jgi:hypothetical protein
VIRLPPAHGVTREQPFNELLKFNKLLKVMVNIVFGLLTRGFSDPYPFCGAIRRNPQHHLRCRRHDLGYRRLGCAMHVPFSGCVLNGESRKASSRAASPDSSAG